MKRTMTVTQTYDPCYGFKVIRTGQTITVVTLSDSHGVVEYRIVACSNGDTFPGWGMKVEQYELRRMVGNGGF